MDAIVWRKPLLKPGSNSPAPLIAKPLMIAGLPLLLLLMSALLPSGAAQTPTNADATDVAWRTRAELLDHARQLSRRGQTEAAIAALEQGIERWPDFAEAYNNLAVMHANLGELARAKVILEQGIHSDAAFAMLFRNLGRLYESLARSAYHDAQVDQDPTAPRPHLAALEMLHADRGQPPPAAPPEPPAVAPITVSDAAPPPAADAQPSAPPITTSSAPTTPALPVSGPPPDPTTAITQAALAWAEAWSNQDMVAYLRAYHPEFKPTSGTSRQRWMATRSQRIERPEWIEVTLSELSVAPLSSRRQAVDFRQTYRNERFTSVVRKRLVMEWGSDGWQIISEMVTDKNAE